MERARFVELVAEAVDTLPKRFRRLIDNVAVLVEDVPQEQQPRPGRPHVPERARPRRLVLGLFVGVPRTQKSVFSLPTGPDYIVLYQKNIEAVCSDEREIRRQVRRTVIHELGHYFGMSEDQLKDV